LGTLASSRAPELSSKSLQCTTGAEAGTLKPRSWISLRNCIIGMVSRSASLRQTHSASVLDKAISVCSLECHTTGHPAHLMMQPVLDFVVASSSLLSPNYQLPLWSASANTVKEKSFGSRIRPSSLVPLKYRPILLTAATHGSLLDRC
jgi:hypothetical protein